MFETGNYYRLADGTFARYIQRVLGVGYAFENAGKIYYYADEPDVVKDYGKDPLHGWHVGEFADEIDWYE